MTTLREAAQMALEALEDIFGANKVDVGAINALRAALAEPDLSRCPNCKGPADNGHDRCIPPNVYWCTKCMTEYFGANPPKPSEEVQSTHSEECWKWHHECAIARIEELKLLCEEMLSELYVYRASKHLKDVTAAIRARGDEQEYKKGYADGYAAGYDNGDSEGFTRGTDSMVPASLAAWRAETKPLTEAQIYAAIKGIDSLKAVEVARAIERAHGIGEKP